jgi:hypothetical protein
LTDAATGLGVGPGRYDYRDSHKPGLLLPAPFPLHTSRPGCALAIAHLVEEINRIWPMHWPTCALCAHRSCPPEPTVAEGIRKLPSVISSTVVDALIRFANATCLRLEAALAASIPLWADRIVLVTAHRRESLARVLGISASIGHAGSSLSTIAIRLPCPSQSNASSPSTAAWAVSATFPSSSRWNIRRWYT